MSEIIGSVRFKCVALLTLLYGCFLTSAGFIIGRINDSGVQDFRQRWFEIQHFFHRINPFDVMSGGVDCLDGVPFMYVGGYPPWSYIIGSAFAPPVSFRISLAVFTVIQILSLLGILVLLWKTAIKSLHSPWVALFFVGLFLSLPGLATDLRWGNYTVISLFFLLLSINLCGTGKVRFDFLAALFYAVAFIKPQLAALFGIVLLFKGLWRVWLPAGLIIAWCTVMASIWLQETPWVLCKQLFESTVRYTELYSYARYYNHGLLDIIKLFNVPVSTISKCNFFIGIVAVVALVLKYRGKVSSLSLWAIPAVFVPLWAYNQKYDWLVIGFLLFAFGVFAFKSDSKVVKRNIVCFSVLSILTVVFTFKLVWFGYIINCWIQFALRLLWLSALVALLHWQSSESKEVHPVLGDVIG